MNDYQLERLKLAFSHNFVGSVIDADGEVDSGELDFIEHLFPTESMQSSGFLGLDGRYTDAYRVALEESMQALPGALSREEKINLVKMLYHAAIADGNFAFQEGNVVVLAGKLLGLSGDDITDALGAGDDLELPEPEGE